MAEVVIAGSFVQDLAFQTESFPAPGETRIGSFRAGPGGKGFNQAVACRRLGVETKFIGAIGEDIFGKGAEAFASAEGIEVAFLRIGSHPSGAASILIDAKGQNSIVVALGANDELDGTFTAMEVERAARAKVVVAQLECRLEGTAGALAAGRKKGLIRVLNPAPINPGLSQALLAEADILVPNETEFAFLLAHCFGEKCSAPERLGDAALHALCRRLEAPTVVITLGAQGSFVSHAEPRPGWARNDTLPFYRLGAIEVEPVDTTGAGDAFTGGLAAGLVRFPGEFARAARFANVVAGLSVEKPGTAPAMPVLAEVEKIFHSLED